MRYYAPNQSQYVSQHVALPLEYLQANLDKRQKAFDDEIARMEAEGKLPYINSLNPDTQRLRDKEKYFKENIDKLSQDLLATGNISQISPKFLQLKREKESYYAPTGEGGAIAGNYATRAEFVKRQRERLEKQQITQKDFELALNNFDANYKGVGDGKSGTYESYRTEDLANYVNEDEFIDKLKNEYKANTVQTKSGTWYNGGDGRLYKDKDKKTEVTYQEIMEDALGALVRNKELINYKTQSAKFAGQKFELNDIYLKNEKGEIVKDENGNPQYNMNNSLVAAADRIAGRESFVEYEKDQQIHDDWKYKADYQKKLDNQVPTFTGLIEMTSNNGRPETVQKLDEFKATNEAQVQDAYRRVEDYATKNGYTVMRATGATGATFVLKDSKGAVVDIKNKPGFQRLWTDLQQADKARRDLEEFEKKAKAAAGITGDWQVTGKIKEDFDEDEVDIINYRVSPNLGKTIDAKTPEEAINSAKQLVNSATLESLKKEGKLTSWATQKDVDNWKAKVTSDITTAEAEYKKHKDTFYRNNDPRYNKYEKELEKLAAGDTKVVGFTSFEDKRANEEALRLFEAFAIDGPSEGGPAKVTDAKNNELTAKEYAAIASGKDGKTKPVFGGWGYVDGKMKLAYRYYDKENNLSKPVFIEATEGVQKWLGYEKNDYNEAQLMSQLGGAHDNQTGETEFGLAGTPKWKVKVVTPDNTKGVTQDASYEAYVPGYKDPISFSSAADLKNTYYKSITRKKK